MWMLPDVTVLHIGMYVFPNWRVDLTVEADFFLNKSKERPALSFTHKT